MVNPKLISIDTASGPQDREYLEILELHPEGGRSIIHQHGILVESKPIPSRASVKIGMVRSLAHS